ncbi:MAG: hypothetical protein R2880_10595 [Deinococcales bacterium]
MPKLSFYVSEELAQDLRLKAKEKDLSLSRLIADMVRCGLNLEIYRDDLLNGWPLEFFDLIGSWEGDVPNIEELPWDIRPNLDNLNLDTYTENNHSSVE